MHSTWEAIDAIPVNCNKNSPTYLHDLPRRVCVPCHSTASARQRPPLLSSVVVNQQNVKATRVTPTPPRPLLQQDQPVHSLPSIALYPLCPLPCQRWDPAWTTVEDFYNACYYSFRCCTSTGTADGCYVDQEFGPLCQASPASDMRTAAVRTTAQAFLLCLVPSDVRALRG